MVVQQPPGRRCKTTQKWRDKGKHSGAERRPGCCRPRAQRCKALHARWAGWAGQAGTAAGLASHEKIAGYFVKVQDTRTMDAEHINLIGTTLEDLSSRTQELRRYL